MRKWIRVILAVLAAFLVVAVVALFVAMRPQGIAMVTKPMQGRPPVNHLPSSKGLPYEDATVTTADGLQLVGWYVPSQNGAAVIAQHGYGGNRTNMLYDADILHRHGYGVLMSTVRAHDKSDGVLVTFGKYEMQDLEAWYQYLQTRTDIDKSKIGILGESMGGALAIQYAAQNPNIRGVAAHSAFGSFKDTVNKAVTLKTGLPPFPFAPVIVFWAERTADIRASDIDTTKWIGKISPRPVLIMMGGADDHISIDSGQKLCDAAGEPKELCFEPAAGHHGLPEVAPAEYERRVVGFFDRALLGK
jgi:uncharacterized protein